MKYQVIFGSGDTPGEVELDIIKWFIINANHPNSQSVKNAGHVLTVLESAEELKDEKKPLKSVADKSK